MNLIYDRVEKRFATRRGPVAALRGVSLEIAAGEFFVLLGPSGCGKSTLLNLAAGLEKPTAGEIRFGERAMAAPARRLFVPPGGRNVAMVFQSYALYPHLTVFGNIAFPLQVGRVSREEIRRATAETAERLGIGDLLERRPAELSGGQRQRVAMARALVRRPDLFLLDEPLSNLDAQLRTEMRSELRRLQRELGVTTLYVTHDQTEAMTLGQRVALLREGEVVQCASPGELYENPATPFAAAFIGSPPMNLFPARLEEGSGRRWLAFGTVRLELPEHLQAKARDAGRDILLGIRPEHLEPGGGEGDLSGQVTACEPLGREALLHVETAAGKFLMLSPEAIAAGQGIPLHFDRRRLHLFFR